MSNTSPVAEKVAGSIISLRREYRYIPGAGNVYDLEAGLNITDAQDAFEIYDIVEKGLIALGAHFEAGAAGCGFTKGAYATRDPSKFLITFSFKDRELIDSFIKDVKRLHAASPSI